MFHNGHSAINRTPVAKFIVPQGTQLGTMGGGRQVRG